MKDITCGAMWERVPERKGKACMELATHMCSDGFKRCIIHYVTFTMKVEKKRAMGK